MKRTIINSLLLSIIVLALGCTKKVDYLVDRTFPTTTDAFLKINYLSAYAGNPGVQLSVNGQRVSGVINSRTPFPGGGYNTNGSNFPDYLLVKAGVNNLSIAIPKKGTNTDSVALFTTNLTLTAGKNYTVHVSDTSAKTSALLVEDNMDIIEVGKARYKFVNMMPNVPLADLYFGSTLVAPGVGYLGQSNYFTLPFSTTATAWNVRETGTGPTGLILATYSSINTTLNQRGYTVFALGYKGATGARLPFVSFLLNK